ncbi:NAD-dependent epimerase/dehydratase family protein [Bordetella sp. 2513F-2]
MRSTLQVLVTGASGFIGRRVCARLLQEGHRVVALSRRMPQAGGLTCIAADLTEPLDAVLGGLRPDAIVHLAARAHVLDETLADPLPAFRRVNRDATAALARWALGAGVQRFVYVSSIGVNGDRTGPGEVFTEASEPRPAGDYAVSKLEAEEALREISAGTQLETCVVRPPLVYGRGAPGNFGRLARLVASGLPLPFGALHNRRSFIHVEDLARFLCLCVHAPAAAGQLFLASDTAVLSTADLVRLMAAARGRPARLVPVPSAILRALAAAVGKAGLADKLMASLEIDPSHARNTLQWEPQVDPAEGWREAFADARPR